MTAREVVTPRAVCRRCRRPVKVCYCAALTTITTQTRVVILQHPRERDMPIGTARMASLCLPNSELHVGMQWGEGSALAAALADPTRPPILLYPGPGARDILTQPPRGPVTLVVIDGTWSQAKNLVRDNPALLALPRYAFTTPEPTRYRIRREPDAAYVSTIEALMHVLGVLEGEPERFRALLVPFAAMVDAQLACQATAPQRFTRRVLRPKKQQHDLPKALTERFADLVCVVAEANAWPYSAGEATPEDELVHWVAHRLGSGETFDRIAAPREPLSPTTTRHTDLDAACLFGGVPRERLVEDYARFVRSTDVICSWGHYATNLMVASGGPAPSEWLDLRGAARRITKRRVGTLETFAATIPMESLPPLGRGRAGRRLAALVSLVRHWHGRG